MHTAAWAVLSFGRICQTGSQDDGKEQPTDQTGFEVCYRGLTYANVIASPTNVNQVFVKIVNVC